jgi:hypothetical protein
MNLKIEHLAPYLPYKLYCRSSKHQFKYGEYHNLLVGGASINRDGELNIELFHDNDLVFSDNIKPVKLMLKPLVDLLSTVEYGNEYMAEWEFIESQLGGCGCVAYEEYMASFIDDICPSRAIQAPYEIFRLLLEYHFDVFGLIDQELAIDVNTLKS